MRGGTITGKPTGDLVLLSLLFVAIALILGFTIAKYTKMKKLQEEPEAVARAMAPVDTIRRVTPVEIINLHFAEGRYAGHTITSKRYFGVDTTQGDLLCVEAGTFIIYARISQDNPATSALSCVFRMTRKGEAPYSLVTAGNAIAQTSYPEVSFLLITLPGDRISSVITGGTSTFCEFTFFKQEL